eukprot:1157548-Pelagomonas_calceolata.AAC.3
MHRGHNAIPDMPPGGHVSSAAAHGHPAQAECTELFTCPHPHRLLPPPLLSHTRSISKSGTFLLQLSCPRRQVGCKASGGFESLAAWGCLPLPLSGPLQLPTHTGGSAWARGAAACNAAGSTARLALLVAAWPPTGWAIVGAGALMTESGSSVGAGVAQGAGLPSCLPIGALPCASRCWPASLWGGAACSLLVACLLSASTLLSLLCASFESRICSRCGSRGGVVCNAQLRRLWRPCIDGSGPPLEALEGKVDLKRMLWIGDPGAPLPTAQNAATTFFSSVVPARLACVFPAVAAVQGVAAERLQGKD